MIARLLRCLWIATGLTCAAAAWWSIDLVGGRIGPWAAGLLGIAAVIALHPAVVAVNFVASRIAGDAVPPALRLSLWQAIATYDAELDASMRGLWFATPFLAGRPARRPAAGTALRPLPILFIHGYLCNRAIWLSFMRDAASRGYLCEAVTLPNPFASIDSQLPVVDRAIDDLLRVARDAGLAAERVAIVAHSMGGLVARALLLGDGASRVGPVVTLGTPHHGTHTARFGRVASVVQMRRGGSWLAGLHTREALAGRGRMTTVFSPHDQIVYPQTTGTLDGATTIAIGGCGHVALVYDRRVREVVFERLAAAPYAASDGAAAS